MASPLKLANNAVTKLAGAITITDTTFNVTPGEGARFPAIGAGEFAPVTLIAAGGTREIVKVTARSSDTFTVVRGHENTAAAAFAAGDRVELRLTAGAVKDELDRLDTAAVAEFLAGAVKKIGRLLDFRSAGTTNTFDARLEVGVPSAGDGTGIVTLTTPKLVVTGDLQATTLRGAIENAARVTAALGFTPANKAGDDFAGPVKLPDGTVAAPALCFTSDANTGFYRVSDGVIGIACNGVLVATISSAGIKSVGVTNTSTLP